MLQFRKDWKVFRSPLHATVAGAVNTNLGAPKLKVEGLFADQLNDDVKQPTPFARWSQMLATETSIALQSEPVPVANPYDSQVRILIVKDEADAAMIPKLLKEIDLAEVVDGQQIRLAIVNAGGLIQYRREGENLKERLQANIAAHLASHFYDESEVLVLSDENEFTETRKNGGTVYQAITAQRLENTIIRLPVAESDPVWGGWVLLGWVEAWYYVSGLDVEFGLSDRGGIIVLFRSIAKSSVVLDATRYMQLLLDGARKTAEAA